MVFRIGILGGGPAGLTAALALESYCNGRDIQVTLIDRNKSAKDYPGVEYGIQERACRAFERMGIKGEALRRGNPNTVIEFRNGKNNTKQGEVKTNPNYCVCVVRQDFLADLESLLKSTKILRQHIVTKIHPHADSTMEVYYAIGKETIKKSMTFDFLVAADGVQSIVRKAFFPEHETVYDRGFSSLYMLIEIPENMAPQHFSTLANGSSSILIMGTSSTATLFPMGKNRLAVGIGFDHAVRSKLWSEQDLPTDMEWSDIPAAKKHAIALKLAEDAPYADGVIGKSMAFVPDWDHYKIYLWKMRDSDALPEPFAKANQGNFVVIGDAAHAIMPTIGMGASLAIEDAERLGSLMAQAINAVPNAEALGTRMQTQVCVAFAKERYPVWKDLISRARKAAALNFTNISHRKRFSMSPQIPGTVLSTIVAGFERVRDRLGL